MSGSPAIEVHPLKVDPSGNAACSTRKLMGWSIFVSGLLFMGFDLYLNSGNNLVSLAAFTGSGPALYNVARASNEFQLRKWNGKNV